MVISHKEFRKQMKYINEAMNCSCFPDLLQQKLFSDAKKLTESFAAYSAIRNKLQLRKDSVYCCAYKLFSR